ncbi:MAG: hypothetical protein CL790_04455 [Chloroflexi bacterium]|nr:hypothetical protein [Chloroflexota bacterium]|tara:strand:- start:81 stop:1766 length:1686 start_codon:yes stop_codon:yes gene_type:complete
MNKTGTIKFPINKSLRMKAVTLFIIAIGGIALSSTEETYAVNVDKNLPMGNAEDIRIEGDVVHFAAQKWGSPRSMWFGFRINGAKGKKITCIWERTNEALGSGSLGAAVPVYRAFDNDPFKRIQASACEYQPEHNRFVFDIPCESNEVHVYYCYPYGPTELDAFFSSIQDSEFVRISTLTKSEGGRPSKLLEISDKRGKGKKQVWYTARAHSGEVTGSFVLEGIVRNILADPKILKKADFYFVPFVDTDGVWLGYYGKDREPRDFNRDYCLDPIRPEIDAILEAVRSKSSGRVDYSFDLHAPTPGGPVYLVPPKLSIISEDEWKEFCKFAAILEEFSPESCPAPFSEFLKRGIGGAMNWTNANYDMTNTTFFYRAYGALSFTLETPYHRGEGMSGKVLEPNDWRKVGHGLTEALRASLDGKLKEIGETVDRGIDILSEWHLVRSPSKVKLSEADETLEIESVEVKAKGDSFVWLASNAVCETVSFDYELEGTIRQCQLSLKEVGASNALPTGRFETYNLELDASSTSFEKSAEKMKRFRVLLRIDGLNGKLRIKLRYPAVN